MSTEHVFRKQIQLPLMTVYRKQRQYELMEFSKPSFHPLNKDILIFCASTGRSAHVYQFNTRTNSIKSIFDYDETRNPVEYPSHFIDTKKKNIHVFLNEKDLKIDLNSLDAKLTDNTSHIATYGQCVPINESKIYCPGTNTLNRHFLFNCDDESFLEVGIFDVRYPKVTFPPSRKQLIIAGGSQCDQILTCIIDDEKELTEKSFVWALKNNLKMPYFVEI